jgi:hypothetical protein
MMPAAAIIGFIALGVGVIVAVFFVVPKVVFLSIKGPLEAGIAIHYGNGEILMEDLRANSFGLESAGAWQPRGNGGLVLTEKYVHFFMFLPKRDLRVPLDTIMEVTFTRSHLGKATIDDLLKVRFSMGDKTDSIALYLTDPKAWKNRIEELKAAAATKERR